MSPSVNSISPAIMFSVVVLPQPEGPTSETNSPSWIVSETWSTATTSPYIFTTLSSTTSAIAPLRRVEGRRSKVEGLSQEPRSYPSVTTFDLRPSTFDLVSRLGCALGERAHEVPLQHQEEH